MQRPIDAIAYAKTLREERDYPNRSDEFKTAIDVALADLNDEPTIEINGVAPPAEVRIEAGDFWIARIKFWIGSPEIVTVIKIHSWKTGPILFYIAGDWRDYPVDATACQLFELLEKIEVDKYK